MNSITKSDSSTQVKTNKTKMKRENMGYLYILPWIIGFLIFQFYPLGMSLMYAFTDYGLGDSFNFVGLANFERMFTVDDAFFHSMSATFRYVLMSVPLKLMAALAIAMILNSKLAGINMFRTVYYLPSIMGASVAVSLLWRHLFTHNGAINHLLGFVGIGPIGWLTNPRIALFTLSLLSVWQFGSSMVFFLAALKQIPQELLESARVDGAGRVRIFFKITIPMITPIILFNLIMQMINAFQEFTAPFIITNGGGPVRATLLYGVLLYQNAFQFGRMGYASALSWVLFVIILLFTALVFRSSSYWAYYSDES